MKGPRRPRLDRDAMHDDPIDQFAEWYREAREKSGLSLPGATCLSTVGPEGAPQGRMVLLKGADARGFVFYTNLESRKAEALESTPRAALTFYWEPLRRQVRVEGDVERIAEEEEDAYFATRPRGSQIGAWASEQSRPASDRDALDRAFERARERFRDTDEIPRPPFWGGYRIRPRAVEFWQEGPDRMHDRFRYVREGEGWAVERLQP